MWFFRPRTGPAAEPAAAVVSEEVGDLAGLRLESAVLAEGVLAGQHRSRRAGGGLEFLGHRPYVAGDDLRFLDRRSLLRYDEPLLRLSEADADHDLTLIIDCSPSMHYRSSVSWPTRYRRAAVLSSALVRIAVAGGDRCRLLLWGSGQAAVRLSGQSAFAAATARLAEADMGSSEQQDSDLERLLRTQRGHGLVLLISDFLEESGRLLERLRALQRTGRTVALRLLDPAELDFPYGDHTTLVSPESELTRHTGGPGARTGYLESLAAHTARQRELLERSGTRYLVGSTGDPPRPQLLQLLQSFGGLP